MNEGIDISCPVSAERVNENVVRTVALEVLMLAIISLSAANYIISGILAADFAIRAFTKGDFSVLRFIALQINKILQLKIVPIGAAPKKFAAGVGFVFALSISVFQYLQMPYAAYSIGAILLICAFLEGVLGFCVGCVVYTLAVRPFLKIK